MRCFPVLSTGFLLLGLMGCAEEKGAPVKSDDSGPKGFVSPLEPVKPLKEDPAARAIVSKAVAAHTGGNPGKLEKFKTNHVLAKGRMVGPDGRTFVESEIEWWAAWPDKIAIRFDQEGQTMRSWAVNASNGSQRMDARTVTPLTPAEAKVIHTDCTALAWGGLLGVLANPDAIFHSPGTTSLDGRTFQVVKCYLPGQPEWTLWFDDKTSLLDRILYQGLEGAMVKAKTLTLASYAEEQGVKQPKQIGLLIGGAPLFHVNVSTLETPSQLESKTVSEPPTVK